ncbi:MAG: hypothetical protein RLZZ265_3118 [Verrucomicrobiota bacterium]|jgi:predicted nucleic-acid-binding Zn-ribbon protein
MKTETAKCPECGGESLHEATTSAGGGYGPDLLSGLGRWGLGGLIQVEMAKFRVVVCAACGLTRFYAEEAARAKLATADRWQRI